MNNEDYVIIESDSQLEEYLKKFNCDSIELLDNLLWYTYGIQLVDNRKSLREVAEPVL